jgi:hypothetical protein
VVAADPAEIVQGIFEDFPKRSHTDDKDKDSNKENDTDTDKDEVKKP